MIVGESPGPQEEYEGVPFIGPSGHELNRQLQSAGILRAECRITNVVRFRPPTGDISYFATKKKGLGTSKGFTLYEGLWVSPTVLEHLQDLEREIHETSPNVIVAVGELALWALTGKQGISDWQGSEMPSRIKRPENGDPYKVVPILHPAFILRGQFDKRFSSIEYLRRVRREADTPVIYEKPYRFYIRPTFRDTMDYLTTLRKDLDRGPVKFSADIETRGHRHIACLGLARDPLSAICIPFLCLERREGYWSFKEELTIVELLREILNHPNARLIGQNWAYDAQYIARWWGTPTRLWLDTMLAHHALWPGLPKALHFLASIYCEHYRWWKGEGKDWIDTRNEDQLWHYNCLDCVYTFEVAKTLEQITPKMPFGDMTSQVEFVHRVHQPTIRMILRGIRQDRTRKQEIQRSIESLVKERQEFINYVAGHPLNPKSPKQMMRFFYDDLRLDSVVNPKTHRPTLNEAALSKLAAKQPVLKPLIDAILEYRSMSVVLKTFVESPLDWDGRMRCSFNQAGTETFRFSSSTNVFGSGGNLQNIPRADKLKGEESPQAAELRRQIRRLFQPDPGYILAEWDLDRADLQVVVWEAGDQELKQMLREGIDIHTENAKLIGCTRLLAKHLVHAMNYGITARTMARRFAMTVHMAENTINRWFGAHPSIRRWHERIQHELRTRRYVKNPFGFVRYYFEPPKDLLKHALSWCPQSTVALVTLQGLVNLDNQLPEVEPLLQVHDSLILQIPEDRWPEIKPKVDEALRVPIPYEDPLIIPISCKWSRDSWGDVEEFREPSNSE
ncbi:MAG: hypothetical protein JRI39_00475 [Deltaproteobacteria bacterium]|nr:hypothetical protein [Deltaproteobacteria bacterium]